MLTALVCWTAVVVVLSAGPRGRTGLWRHWPGAADAAAERVADAVMARLAGRGGGDDLIALCSAVSAELRSGAPAEAALLAAAHGRPLVPRAVVAAQLGEPVAKALRADAEAARRSGRRHADAISGMAACWHAAAGSGAGLADGLDRVAALSRAAQRVEGDLRAEIAAPRATARILSMLPLLGILLGELLGARPISWLLTSPFGWACLAAGGCLLGLGWFWSSRIVAGALPRSVGAGA